MMTKKDYRLIASVIALIPEETGIDAQQHERIAEMFAEALHGERERWRIGETTREVTLEFDTEKFMRACGIS